ncbi:hypothetical protein [Streptomyces sp. NPDC001492]
MTTPPPTRLHTPRNHPHTAAKALPTAPDTKTAPPDLDTIRPAARSHGTETTAALTDLAPPPTEPAPLHKEGAA